MSALDEIACVVREFVDAHPIGDRVCVALSGGADSLALTAGALAGGLSVTAIVVDHRLQPGSDEVALTAAARARELGADALLVSVTVGSAGGPEGAARRARYAALDAARDGRPVLLGHTLDDQAETVVLGLGRGSGARSLAGMVSWSSPWGRPLLGVRRSTTVAACAELDVAPWHDPHNTDARFVRVRLRTEVLPLLDDVLGPGVATALARTARQLREDTEVLDALARAALSDATDGDRLDRAVLMGQPAAIRRRVVRLWILAGGATEPTERLLLSLDDLVFDPRPHASVAIGGDSDHRLVVACDGPELMIRRDPRD